MPDRRFNPTLPIAFALAVVLHIALLPLVLMGVESGGADRPDKLALVAVDGPVFARAGEDIAVDVVLNYDGPAAGPVGLRVAVSLSRSRSLDITDERAVTVYDERRDAAFGPTGGRATMSLPVHLPEDSDGAYQLIVSVTPIQKEHLDGSTDWSDCVRATPIYITGPQRPELALPAADLPARAIAGGTALFGYTATNLGPGWASTPDGRGGWHDRVYLSTDTTLDENDLPLRTFARRSPLSPGESYTHQRVTLDLPRVPAGVYHLILAADADQVLDQPSFSAGLYTAEIELVDTLLPDLVIASAASPRTATLGEPFALQWSVANLGSVACETPRHDAVYLSRDDTLDPADTLLTVAPAYEPIAAQSQHAGVPVAITIPNEPQFEPGAWHLILITDHGNAIDEGPFEDNNAFAIPITLRAAAEAEPELGEPDNDPRLTIAWIEHDRVEQHMARLTETIQPAIQNILDPDPDAALVRDPKPPAPPAIALQPGGAPNDPANPVDPNQQNNARPRPPVPDAPDTNTAPRPLDPNAQQPERVEGLDGNADDLPMPRDGRPTPAPDAPDNNPVRPDEAERDDRPTRPGDREVESDADPDAPDTDSETDSQTPAERDADTDETNPDDNDSDQPSDVMEESAGDTPTENDPSEEPTETDGQGDADDDQQETTANPDPAEEDSDRPEGDPVPPSNPSEEEETTRAPRDDAEADPTDNTPDRLRLEEGGVLVGQGVRVNTSRIRRGSTTSRLTAIPRDTYVRVVFDNQGRVVEAEILGEGTGYDDWDSRLLEALYRWNATGPDIRAADPHYVLQLEYQFGLLNRRSE